MLPPLFSWNNAPSQRMTTKLDFLQFLLWAFFWVVKNPGVISGCHVKSSNFKPAWAGIMSINAPRNSPIFGNFPHHINIWGVRLGSIKWPLKNYRPVIWHSNTNFDMGGVAVFGFFAPAFCDKKCRISKSARGWGDRENSWQSIFIWFLRSSYCRLSKRNPVLTLPLN